VFVVCGPRSTLKRKIHLESEGGIDKTICLEDLKAVFQLMAMGGAAAPAAAVHEGDAILHSSADSCFRLSRPVAFIPPAVTRLIASCDTPRNGPRQGTGDSLPGQNTSSERTGSVMRNELLSTNGTDFQTSPADRDR
jgi:hypothetical protein